MTDPLAELQVKVAFLEDTLAKLSDEFYAQHKALVTLQQHHAALAAKMRSNEQGSGDASFSETSGVDDEKPPHY